MHVLAAWGHINSRLDATNKFRQSLVQFLALSSSRPWVRRSHLSLLGYWRALAKYRYCICPPGNGVQSPKLAEAWLTHTVPISIRLPAHQDLKKLGFPLLLVEDWGALGPALLREEYERTYRHVNWSSVQRLLRPEHIVQMVLTS
jgi:hypothetical protein